MIDSDIDPTMLVAEVVCDLQGQFVEMDVVPVVFVFQI